MEIEVLCLNARGEERCSCISECGWVFSDGICRNDSLGIVFRCEEIPNEEGFEVRIPRESIQESGEWKIREITVFSGLTVGKEGDGGALVLPVCTGILCRTEGHDPGEYRVQVFAEQEYNPYWSNMPIFGAYADGKAALGIVKGGKYDFDICLRTAFGPERMYSVDPVFMVRDYYDEEPIQEDISIQYSSMNGDWRELARFYRKWNVRTRNLPTIEEKIRKENNTVLEYASRAITMRFRLAVKPLPCTVYEQTPETEPVPNIYMTFENVSSVLKEFRRQNVGPVECCLVGWNHGGHDGAFPQLLPVEEHCGGEKELRKTLETARETGYPLSFHDNYYDGYTLADNFDFDDVCADHGPFKTPVRSNAGIVAGGRAYRVCAEKAATKYAVRNLHEIHEKFDICGSYFSDVISIIGLHKCYHVAHPLDRAGNAKYYKEIMALKHRLFSSSMSEGARDWALPELDRAFELANVVDHVLPYADEHVPFFQMVYHGFVIYNNYREGINAWPGEEAYLRNLSYGGMPLLYFHHVFHPEWTAAGGWAADLKFTTREALEKDVARIRKITDDMDCLKEIRFAFLDDFIRHSDTLTETVYSNGRRLFVNYASEPAVLKDGSRVEPRNFILK